MIANRSYDLLGDNQMFGRRANISRHGERLISIQRGLSELLYAEEVVQNRGVRDSRGGFVGHDEKEEEECASIRKRLKTSLCSSYTAIVELHWVLC